MALPTLNELPKYTLTVPSTGKSLNYRPYLVKEEKVLLVASSSEDPKQVMNAIYDTIKACVEDVDLSSLTTFDLEYIFIQLRMRSTGETSEIVIRCPSCNEPNNKIIPLMEIECTKSDANPIIPISDTVTVEMKYPSYMDLPDNMDETEIGFGLVASSIKTVISGDEKIDVADEPIESVMAFLESMTQEQFKKVTDFFEDTPTVKYDLELDCKECGEHSTVEIKGMQSFF